MSFLESQTKFLVALFLLSAFIALAPTLVWSHPGRTASDGCHYCRTRCDYWGVPWNERHCHGGGSVSTPRSPSLTPPAPTPAFFNEAALLFSVTRVIDGDTIEIRHEGEQLKKVRLIGIDTPETVDPRKPVQCFGREASEKTKSLLEGKKVRLEKDSIGDTIDKYGRLLRYVYADGVLVNAELVKQGYAYAYLNFSFSKSAEFKQYEIAAKQNQVGLWSPSACGAATAAISSPVTKEMPKLSGRDFVTSQKEAYRKNPHGFRERLISQMQKSYSSQRDLIAYWVYTLLSDVK